ncbi:hypothetical protein LguiA_028596 [Lonicera macranthoides]
MEAEMTWMPLGIDTVTDCRKDHVTSNSIIVLRRKSSRPVRPQPRNIYPHGFVSGSSRSASQRVTHPGIALILYSLNFGVLMGSEARLLPNGNFEYGPKSWQMKGTKVTKHNGIPNWEISGFVEYIKSGQKQGDMLLVVPEGDFAVRLGEEASIKTKLEDRSEAVKTNPRQLETDRLILMTDRLSMLPTSFLLTA